MLALLELDSDDSLMRALFVRNRKLNGLRRSGIIRKTIMRKYVQIVSFKVGF